MTRLALEDWPTSPVGQVADSGVINRNNSRIEQILNGGVEDENLGANVPVVVATTIAGLGTTYQGKAGMLRLATTPFEFVRLWCDGTNKWMGHPIPLLNQRIGQTYTTPITWQLGNAQSFPACFLPNYKAIYDAGLRPDFYVAAKVHGLPGFDFGSQFRVSIFEVADGDTALASVASSEPVITAISASVYTTGGGWQPADTISAPSKAHAYALAEVQKDGDPALGLSVEAAAAWMRWREP